MIVDLLPELLRPAVTDESRPFWEGTRAGELRMQACAACGRLRFPPRPMCPWCRSVEREWRPMSGLGTVWSFVVAHPPLLPAYEAIAPYPVAVVELDEEPTLRLVGNLVPDPEARPDAIDPATIAIGLRVRAVFVPFDAELTVVRWLPA